MSRAGGRRGACVRFAGPALAWLLTACGRPQPPVVAADYTPPVAAPAPDWLPAGWVIAAATPVFTPDALATRVYCPAGATAPLLLLARLPADQTTRLAERVGGSAVDWLVAQTLASLQLPGTTAGEPKRWRQAGLAEGRHFAVTGQLDDSDRGPLTGEVAIGRTNSGQLLLAAALVPVGEDVGLADQLLALIPVEGD